eukprot:12188892-Alexandrium_andersonii.AAC.1
MSASLVGSEMCIRDRRGPLRALGDRRTATFTSPPTATGRSSATSPRIPCLLYTSDAADDM